MWSYQTSWRVSNCHKSSKEGVLEMETNVVYLLINEHMKMDPRLQDLGSIQGSKPPVSSTKATAWWGIGIVSRA